MYTCHFSYICKDIDECISNNGNCEQLCNNFNGSYSCSCNSGYQLDQNQRNCTGIVLIYFILYQ